MGKTKDRASTARGKRKHPEFDPKTYLGCEGMEGETLALFRKLDHPSHKVIVTKFFYKLDLGELRMQNLLELMMVRAGLRDLYAENRPYTYKSLTLEFITTLRKHLPDDEEEENFITFTMLGRNRMLTYSELREAFGVEAPDGGFVSLTNEECVSFWRDITGGLLRTNNSKNVEIPNPLLRLIHRFTNMAFLAQGEPTKAPFVSLRHLWAFTPMGGGIPDWVDMFVEGCLYKQNGDKGGRIPMGGMITLIAESLGIDTSEFIPVAGNHLYDFKGLAEVGMIHDAKASRKIWCYGPRTEKYMKLPRPRNAPLPYGDQASAFFVLPDREYAEQFLHIRMVSEHNWVNEEGEGLEEEEAGDNDVNMGEGSWDTNWEVPMPQNQGQPWRHQPIFDNSNPQYNQYLQFQQFQQYQQQQQQQQNKQQQQQQHDFFGGMQYQGYEPQFLPDCTPNYDVPPRQDGWWPEYWSRYTTMEDKVDLSYQVSMGVHNANILNKVPNYEGPKREELEAFEMREMQKEIRRMERLEKRRRDQGGPSGSH